MIFNKKHINKKKIDIIEENLLKNLLNGILEMKIIEKIKKNVKQKFYNNL